MPATFQLTSGFCGRFSFTHLHVKRLSQSRMDKINTQEFFHLSKDAPEKPFIAWHLLLHTGPIESLQGHLQSQGAEKMREGRLGAENRGPKIFRKVRRNLARESDLRDEVSSTLHRRITKMSAEPKHFQAIS